MSNALMAAEIVAQRVFNPLYIYLDIVFLVALCVLLGVKKKFLTLLFGIAGGVLYMIVDYGIFHLWTHSRSIEGGSMFWVLLWMSMSYGITNFVWIWLWFSKDRHLLEWSLLIVVWWIAAPMLANTFGGGLPPVKIQRTTGAYRGNFRCSWAESAARKSAIGGRKSPRSSSIPCSKPISARCPFSVFTPPLRRGLPRI